MTLSFSLGIDLGTSNSAVALAEVEGEAVRIVEITQLTGPNQVDEKPTLPSALYIPHRDEFPAGALAVPWTQAEADVVVGQFARERGALDRKSTRLNSSHSQQSRMPSSA